jgi:DtxR family Mn-dependent transcriptional regulator
MERVEQYLVALHVLDAADRRVRTGRLASALGKSPAAATEMVERLADADLVEHEPYAGVRLTSAGARRAAERYETYETLFRFCRDVLDIEDAEREALELVGAVSPEVAQRLKTTLLGPNDSVSPSLDVSNDDSERG